jgi:23S rRNA (guanine2445-N2)-methyltransferase / 23S rRNA (guanine2069-N7)-methyltransferase
MSGRQDFFAVTGKALNDLAAQELTGLGIASLRVQPAGVSFSATLAEAYRVCLWSRVASRVLLPLTEFPAADADALYEGVRTLDWSMHLGAEDTLAVDAQVRSSQLTHSQFVALKTKDAVVDQFSERCGTRPSVDVQRPSIRINVHVQRDQATVSLDLSGASLHRRAYRQDGGTAPLKENLAAAILLRAGWPEIRAAGGDLVDPMCGSGTLLIEAALLAADIAPGLLRDYFGFLGWHGHDAQAWQALLEEAQARRAAGLERELPRIAGYDHDLAAIHAAQANVQQAGVSSVIHIERRDIALAKPPRTNPHPGLVIVNPPYGERLGDADELPRLYRELGRALKSSFSDWHAAVLTGNPEFGFEIGLRSQRPLTFYNGALECRLLRFAVNTDNTLVPHSECDAPSALLRRGAADSAGAQMLRNRLRKNDRHLARWRRREAVSCYRLYDADLPEYALAVDIYETTVGLRVQVAEYQAPASIDAGQARRRLADALAAICAELQLEPDQVFLKHRSRQKGKAQYEKLDASGDFFEVREGPGWFWVNLGDYLDTGLFLDHRITRRMVYDLARECDFLNLFAYTGTASVYAALAGARSTTTVDMSATYLAWAQRNFSLNEITGASHQFIREDCLAWLRKQAQGKNPRQYDLIFLDPPTFSTSKRMTESFDVQRDHTVLIRQAMQLLRPSGSLLFSCNRRGFKLDEQALAEFMVHNISQQTLPADFSRNPKIHSAWRITHRGETNGQTNR